ncbi:MAG: hypothetical protein ABSH20_05730 [Tepidisphaeraceae bacterium]|jgi:hypothetical protein
MSKPRLSKLQQGDWGGLTDAEKQSAFEELDRLGPRLDQLTRPLTKAERLRLLAEPSKAEFQANRGRGRPKLGGVGAKNVLVSVEPSLLDRADAWARKNGLSRSALFSRCVELVVGGR